MAKLLPIAITSDGGDVLGTDCSGAWKSCDSSVLESVAHAWQHPGEVLVSMNHVPSILLDDVRATLLREVSSAVGKHDLSEAFAAWLVGGAVPSLSAIGAMEASIEATGASRTASAVATLGYAANMEDLSEGEPLFAGGHRVGYWPRARRSRDTDAVLHGRSDSGRHRARSTEV